MLGIPVKAVISRVFRAKQIVKKTISELRFPGIWNLYKYTDQKISARPLASYCAPSARDLGTKRRDGDL